MNTKLIGAPTAAMITTQTDAIRVAVRVRPMLADDYEMDEGDLIDHCEDGQSLVVQPPHEQEEDTDDCAKALFGATPGRSSHHLASST